MVFDLNFGNQSIITRIVIVHIPMQVLIFIDLESTNKVTLPCNPSDPSEIIETQTQLASYCTETNPFWPCNCQIIIVCELAVMPAYPITWMSRYLGRQD